MTCQRCRGLMVREGVADIIDDTGQRQHDGWRCINCGEMWDAIVLQHRYGKSEAPHRSYGHVMNRKQQAARLR